MKTAKFFWVVFLISVIGMVACKTASISPQALAELKTVAQEKNFQVDIDRVISSTVPNTERFSPRGSLTVKGDSATAQLPFFGKAYSAAYDGQSGIRFSNVMKDYQVVERKGFLAITFSIRDNRETFDVDLSLYPNGSAFMRISGSQREVSSYQGVYRTVGAP